jgi:hypothetical protein
MKELEITFKKVNSLNIFQAIKFFRDRYMFWKVGRESDEKNSEILAEFFFQA